MNTAKSKVAEVVRKYKTVKAKKEVDDKKILDTDVKAMEAKVKREAADKKKRESRMKIGEVRSSIVTF